MTTLDVGFEFDALDLRLPAARDVALPPQRHTITRAIAPHVVTELGRVAAACGCDEHAVIAAALRVLERRYRGADGDGTTDDPPFAAFVTRVAREAKARLDAPVDDARGAGAVGFRWTAEGAGRLAHFAYDAHVLETVVIERVATHFATLLTSIGAGAQPISGLALADDVELAAVLAFGRGPQTVYERDATIAAVFADRVRETPEALAVVAHDGRLTYRELAARARSIAAALAARGVRPGSTVGVALERSRALPATLLGILSAGASYVALDVTYPAERLAFIVADARVELIVTSRAPRESLATLGVPLVDADAIATADGDDIDRTAGPLAIAYIAYTSGSTGRPKGVAVMQRGVIRLVRNTDFLHVTPSDVFLQFAPAAFDASTLEFWAPLLSGGVLAMCPPNVLGIEDVGKALEAFGVTLLWLTTALFAQLVDAGSPRFRGLRALITGGDVVSPAHARRFLETYPACRLINGYGPTENTTFSTTYEIASIDPRAAAIPIGRPIANSTAYVLDERQRPVPFGIPGELYVGGDGVAAGYVGLPEMTAARFVPDPFATAPEARMYRTGDRVRLRPDGVIDFLGRTDNQVKVRGYRIELGEIEAALQRHPGVAEAAVVLGETAGEKTIVAFVRSAARDGADAATLRAYLAARLPRYMVPHRIELADTLPAHSSGKVDRVALARLAAHVPAAARRGRGGGDLERRIGDVWCEVLGRTERPGVDENFFDVGGDSLLLLVVHKRLEPAIGVPLTVMDLFEHSTIRALAQHVARPRSPADGP